MNNSTTMKNRIHFLKICVAFLLFNSFSLPSHLRAQPLKTAYANETFILSSLPETKQIEADLRAYEKQLQNRLKAKMDDFQAKSQDFQQNYQKLADIERADKQEELATMQESAIKFQRDAESSIQEKQQKLLLPVLKKIQRAIDAIGAKNNYSYIFKAEALLYAKAADDISFRVLERLGVDTSKLSQPPKTSPASAPKK